MAPTVSLINDRFVSSTMSPVHRFVYRPASGRIGGKLAAGEKRTERAVPVVLLERREKAAH